MSRRGQGWAALGCAVAALGVVGAVLADWLRSSAWALRDPVTGLQQLGLLYLNEPAPLLDRLGIASGRPAVLVVCEACPLPDVDAQVVRSADPEVARAYGLMTTDGRVGPGYALIDAEGRVRYRTFDARPAAHRDEIAVLLGGL